MTSAVDHRKSTKDDFRELFTASTDSPTDSLRWLCTTLTGDEVLTDKILNAAFEQSLRGSDHVFREWMLSWARRLVINACAHIMRPTLAREADAMYERVPMRFKRVSEEPQVSLDLSEDETRQRLRQLDALSRFVVVLRGVEAYSRRDTSLLLNIDDATCEWIYARTMEELASHSEHVAGSLRDSAIHPMRIGDYQASL